MSLNEQERTTVVGLEIEKAERFLKEANEMVELKYFGIAANRYYYACFHAVMGLLINNGISVKTHKGLISCFGSNFIKTGKIDLRLGQFLSRMIDLRHKADYNCHYDVSEEDVILMQAPAKELIDTVKNLLK